MQPLQAIFDRAKIHALSWFSQRRGISCNKAGGYCAEYNFRFSFAAANVGDRFLTAMAEVYDHEFR